ncbi:Uncharacterized protein FWK35_00023986 [Aphis craccivora]|uniref:Uncharacterized protein n=1 Tax=Aphis craccivora TaxID=307492 RepID=A0A6G0W0H3_APHCR|nr:Uncharacterized protein FWK35_00023986 [Aphis craccivora]
MCLSEYPLNIARTDRYRWGWSLVIIILDACPLTILAQLRRLRNHHHHNHNLLHLTKFLKNLKQQTNILNLFIGDLKKDVEYPVQSTKAVDTKFGPAVLCVLREPDGSGVINVFLPKSVQLTDVEIAQ